MGSGFSTGSRWLEFRDRRRALRPAARAGATGWNSRNCSVGRLAEIEKGTRVAATHPIIVPEMGESIYQVEIIQWHKHEGQSVEKDENLVEMETDKATVELPSPAAGVVAKILKRDGQTAEVGEIVGYLQEPGDVQPAAVSQAEPVEAVESEGEAKAPTAGGDGEEAEVAKTIEPAAPGRMKVAPERPRTPPEAVPLPEELPAAFPAEVLTAASRREEMLPMSPIRRRIAERLVEAQQTAALVTTFNEIDMSAVIGLRESYGNEFLQRYDAKLGFMSFFVKAAIEGLKGVPELNAEIRGSQIAYRHYYDIGIAIGGGKALVVPVLRNAERMSFAEIERAIADFAARARENRLKPEELQGGTFTITNGGVYGSLLSTPMINPPQSGILGMHAIQDRPVAREGQAVVRPMMYVALTYDHRLVDGREAVGFLRRVKEIVEDPARLMLEI